MAGQWVWGSEGSEGSGKDGVGSRESEQVDIYTCNQNTNGIVCIIFRPVEKKKKKIKKLYSVQYPD